MVVGWGPLPSANALSCERARQFTNHREIPLVTPRFLIDPIELVALLGIFLFDGPRLRPRGRIVHRDDVLDCVRAGAGPAFDQMQVVEGSVKVPLGCEIGDVDDQRVVLPPTARIPPPRADVGGQMRGRRDGDDAMPSLALARVIENRDGSWRLDNLTEATE